MNSGHGCAVCHSVARRGEQPLWGEAADAPVQEQDGILVCTSCHDGNYAPKAMMKDKMYEVLPATYPQLESIPTFQEVATNIGSDFTKHPVGLRAMLGCGGSDMWDCTIKDGVRTMNGVHASKFAANYGFFNEAHRIDGKSVVVCTTCHHPHAMNVTRVTKQNQSNAFPAGVYATRFFLCAPYNPEDTSRTNRSAQYCRQCHADKSNEMNGSTIGGFSL